MDKQLDKLEKELVNLLNIVRALQEKLKNEEINNHAVRLAFFPVVDGMRDLMARAYRITKG